MSKEQWGHGYFRGLEDGMKSQISLFDFIVLRYGNDDTPNGDLARDLLRDFQKNRRFYPQAEESQVKRMCIYNASASSVCSPLVRKLKKEWMRWRLVE